MLEQLLVYVTTLAGAAVALVSPFYGLLVYVAFAVIRPQALWAETVSDFGYSKVIAVALALGWLFNGGGDWRFGRAKSIVICLLGYWGWLVVSALYADDQTLAWETVVHRSKILLPVLIACTSIRSIKQLRQLAFVLAGSQAVVAVLAHISIYVLNQENWLQFEGLGAFDNNDLAVGMLIGASLAFGLGMSETGLAKWIAFGLAALNGHSVLLSTSRGGMLGIAVVAVVVLYSVRREPKHYWLIGTAVLMGCLLVGPYTVTRLSTLWVKGMDAGADASVDGRVVLYKLAWQLNCEKPLIGCGPGHFALESTKLVGRPRATHSLWLETGAELGFPGIISLLGFYVLSFWRSWQLFRAPPVGEPWFREGARIAMYALAGFGFTASFLSIFSLEQPYFMVAFVVGLLRVVDDWEAELEYFPDWVYEHDEAMGGPDAFVS